ncbi:integrase catalytic domain-containing protein [Nephila pilipes]|uniref:Integrase catalytic domain-containing protein n=1 Tax=Nephila pilipes TaxID=299642 RepID=A0A8X6MPP8_NEPPI|nr:integrase catalytic domain-containing protein [Nephila pilipes]
MEAAGMDLRKWITNDTNLMEQWKKEKFDVHPVHETVSLGANETKVLGLSWNTHEDYLTLDTESLLEFLSLDKKYKTLHTASSFIYDCRNKSKKVGPLTVAEFKESEIKFIKHAQRPLFDKKEIPSNISSLFPFVDGEEE